MNYFKNNRQSLIIAALVVLNIAVISSFVIQTQRFNRSVFRKIERSKEIPRRGMNFLFIEELNLDQDQIRNFNMYRNQFQEEARIIKQKIDKENINLFNELSKKEANNTLIDSITSNIGLYHKELKIITSTFYLNLKTLCDSTQQEKLEEIFIRLGSPLAPMRDQRMERGKRDFQKRRGPKENKNQMRGRKNFNRNNNF